MTCWQQAFPRTHLTTHARTYVHTCDLVCMRLVAACAETRKMSQLLPALASLVLLGKLGLQASLHSSLSSCVLLPFPRLSLLPSCIHTDTHTNRYSGESRKERANICVASFSILALSQTALVSRRLAGSAQQGRARATHKQLQQHNELGPACSLSLAALIQGLPRLHSVLLYGNRSVTECAIRDRDCAERVGGCCWCCRLWDEAAAAAVG